jgi:flagellar basal-body rod modification protein FlgD
MSIYDDIGLGTVNSNAAANAAAASQASNSSLSQEDFLSLLTTQLSYQDPTAPVENAEMVSQLAQLSMVESMATLNQTATDLSSSVTSQQALLASSMVGQEVRLSSSSGYFDGSEASQFVIDAGSGYTDMTLTITDSKGSIVNTVNLGDASGDVNLYWDGTDSSGNQVSAGTYTYSVNGKSNGINADVPVYAYGKVTSVTLGSGVNNATLNLVGGGQMSMNEVKNFG